MTPGYRIGGALAALALIATPSTVSAQGFTPEGAAHWVEIARSLIDASNAGPDRMAAVCPSVSPFNGALLHEMTQEPRWAYGAHVMTCYAYKGRAAYACDAFKRAISALGDAKPENNPPEVVAVAAQLKAAITSLGTDYNAAKICKFKAA